MHPFTTEYSNRTRAIRSAWYHLHVMRCMALWCVKLPASSNPATTPCHLSPHQRAEVSLYSKSSHAVSEWAAGVWWGSQQQDVLLLLGPLTEGMGYWSTYGCLTIAYCLNDWCSFLVYLISCNSFWSSRYNHWHNNISSLAWSLAPISIRFSTCISWVSDWLTSRHRHLYRSIELFLNESANLEYTAKRPFQSHKIICRTKAIPKH